ncbi:unnamed protein product [Ilex paraguariensis]|uniref:1-acyl-sn-glycerol-3-phosphate acyltransferase n=1 Tax=Ilex paraguariensis TaxID=185542 RepID=A0ABC8THY7_9AQUA
MEVSFQQNFNNFHLYPHTSLGNLCRMEARFLCPSSLQPSCAHNGLFLGCFPSKQSIWSYSKSYSIPKGNLYTRRQYSRAICCFLNPTEQFTSLYYNHNLQKQDNLQRDFIVRSEIAGAGSHDASHLLLEPQLGSKIRGICFYAITAFTSTFLFVLMLVVHPFVLLVDRHRRKAHHFVAKMWALLTVTPFYKIEIEGLENLPASDTPAVYVSNHQSFLDIYTLLTLGRSFKFISKTTIFLFPVVGWAMFLMGLIPLKRMDSRSHMECLKRCMALINKGGSVFFFPEGTRSKDGRLGAFKKGAFSVAAKTGVPVVPITLIGTGKIMPPGMEGRLNPGAVKVIIHQPIEGNNPDVLCSEARNIIADVLSCQG